MDGYKRDWSPSPICRDKPRESVVEEYKWEKGKENTRRTNA